MATLAAFELTSVLNYLLYGLYVAIGLGLVIFFHELGHFAVAKWCNVFVERFSIGFGPILFSWKWGETEYALSAIPFGGYVKMLGQDDMDPSQLSSDEIAEDPRSYSAKPVYQRMAIISAGVIMNIITGLFFCAGAFAFGVQTMPAEIGIVQVGMPAWRAGLTPGDRITGINGREVSSFNDIIRGVALTSGDVVIDGVGRDGEPFHYVITPDGSGTRRIIGAGPSPGLTLIEPTADETTPAAVPGTAAAEANPPFQPGDTIVGADGTEFHEFWEFQEYLARHRDEPIDFLVRRQAAGDTIRIHVPPNKFSTLGLWMDIGEITAIQDGSPAAGAGGLRVDDKITYVDGQEVGRTINPLELPDYFASRQGREIEVRVNRQVESGEKKEITVRLTPEDRPGWTQSVQSPIAPGAPVEVPSVGIAFQIIPKVLKVEEGSPAAEAGVPTGARVTKVTLIRPKGAPADLSSQQEIEIEINEDEKNWVAAFWLIQQMPTRQVKLTVTKEDGKVATYTMNSRPADRDWHRSSRGIVFAGQAMLRKADGIGEALSMGFVHTQNTVLDIYLTLRNLFGGRLSVKELHGPIGIATVAYQIAREGIPQLLLFLGFLSVNLAVLNFLPIPVLDGGHMVFLLWEAVTRKKPTERVLAAATYCGMIFVLGLMLLVLYLDIFVHQLGVG